MAILVFLSTILQASMRKTLLFILVFFTGRLLSAQPDNRPAHLFLLSEENDGINAWFRGTDLGYTNGIRMDYLAPRKKQNKNHRGKISPVRISTTGWGIQQLMYTPQKTRPDIPDKNDYAYAGGLMAIHTRYHADPQRKTSTRTEWVAGLTGPAAFAGETQAFLHRLIGDPRPNGWSYQVPTDLLLNAGYTYEKQLAGNSNLLLIAGFSGNAGTWRNGVSAFSLLQFQKNMDYFSGLTRQYFPVNAKKPGWAIAVKPTLALLFYDALLDGGLFNSNSPLHNKDARSGTNLERNRAYAGLDFMLRAGLGRFSLSFTQKMYSPDYDIYGWHKVGNISVGYGW